MLMIGSNWLRDYSQAVDVGTLQKVQPATLRILVWILSFLSFGYATAEFEVTEERLGVYRPEEHIDNPKGYADNADARKFDQRLRGPVQPAELEIDPQTGMKNYIANERGDWATSAGFVKYSFTRSIHYGRMYTNGHGLFRGKTEDLCEALRCLGQGLHTLEDFGAHTNYTELALREMGMDSVFPHTGTATQITLHGHHVFPLVTGTFGMVDFFHSVLGEATDHFTQSEVNEMDNALGIAQTSAQSSSPIHTLTSLLSKMPGTRDLCMEAEQLQRSCDAQTRANELGGVQAPPTQGQWQDQGQHQSFWNNLEQGQQTGFSGSDSSQIHGAIPHHNQQASFNNVTGGSQMHSGTSQIDQQSSWNQPSGQTSQPFFIQQPTFAANAPTGDGPAGQGLPGMPNFDPEKTIQQILPILVFRDKVVRAISSVIEKIPGLEALYEKITETLTVFILSLLAPFVRPIIKAVTQSLQTGSAGVVDSSGKSQFEPWTDPTCTDPTHSLLSKDHFSNVLNEPAGKVASEILKYVAPRVLYAWQHTEVPVNQVMNDCMHVFHHPALRNNQIEVHRNMFNAVKQWIDSRSDQGNLLHNELSSEGVRTGKNLHDEGTHDGHTHNHLPSFAGMPQQPPTQPPTSGFSSFLGGGGGQQQQSGLGSLFGGGQQQPQHQQQSTSGFNPLDQLSHLPIPGLQQNLGRLQKFSSFLPGSSRDIGEEGSSRGLGDQSSSHGFDDGGFDGSSSGVPEGVAQQAAVFQQPPSGYEGYHLPADGQAQAYHPPTEGPHLYEYHQSPYGGGSGY